MIFPDGSALPELFIKGEGADFYIDPLIEII